MSERSITTYFTEPEKIFQVIEVVASTYNQARVISSEAHENLTNTLMTLSPDDLLSASRLPLRRGSQLLATMDYYLTISSRKQQAAIEQGDETLGNRYKEVHDLIGKTMGTEQKRRFGKLLTDEAVVFDDTNADSPLLNEVKQLTDEWYRRSQIARFTEESLGDLVMSLPLRDIEGAIASLELDDFSTYYLRCKAWAHGEYEAEKAMEAGDSEMAREYGLLRDSMALFLPISQKRSPL